MACCSGEMAGWEVGAPGGGGGGGGGMKGDIITAPQSTCGATLSVRGKEF